MIVTINKLSLFQNRLLFKKPLRPTITLTVQVMYFFCLFAFNCFVEIILHCLKNLQYMLPSWKFNIFGAFYFEGTTMLSMYDIS